MKSICAVCYWLGVFVPITVMGSRQAEASHRATDSRQFMSQPQSPPARLEVYSYGARWEAGGGFSTTLELRNDGSQLTAAQVSLYSRSGQQVGTSLVQIRPNSSTRLSLASLVSANTTVSGGGLSVRWNGAAQQATGRVVITDPSGSIVSYAIQGGYRYDTEKTLWAPWWLPDAGSDGSITLFNSSEQNIFVSPSITINGLEKTGTPVDIAANASTVLSLRSWLENGGVEGANIGSITLRYTGSANALQPALLLSNPHTGFALMPDFNAGHAQTAEQQTTSWQFPYVSMAMEGGTESDSERASPAKVLLSNGTKQQMYPQITAYAVSQGTVRQIPLPVSVLEPGATRLLDLSQLTEQIPAPVSRLALTVSHAGQPGDLGIAIFSVNASTQVVSRSEGLILPVSDSSISYWDVSSGRGLLHWIKSISGQSASAGATLYFQTANGLNSYSLPTALAVNGDDEKTIDMAQFIRARIPDDNGHTLPPGVSSGLVVLSAAGAHPAPMRGDLLTTCLTECAAQTQKAGTKIVSSIAFVQPDTVAPLCAPPLPICFAQLKYRYATMGQNHAFWWIQDSTGTHYIIDGGPTGSCVPPVPPYCGHLDGWLSVGDAGISPGYPADNSGDSTSYASATSSAVCAQVDALEAYARAWNQTGTNYNPTGPNSNTFAHDCSTAGSFPATEPPSAIGW